MSQFLKSLFCRHSPHWPDFHRATHPGAGDGNRTRIASLEGWSSTTELNPRVSFRLLQPSAARVGGGGRIRTFVGRSQRVYSPSPLATRAPLRNRNHRVRRSPRTIWIFRCLSTPKHKRTLLLARTPIWANAEGACFKHQCHEHIKDGHVA